MLTNMLRATYLMVCITLLGSAIYPKIAHAQFGVSCPSIFNEGGREDGDTVICRGSLTLSNAPPSGQTPEDTDEGARFIRDAQQACLTTPGPDGVNGRRVNSGNIGNTGVFHECRFNKEPDNSGDDSGDPGGDGNDDDGGSDDGDDNSDDELPPPPPVEIINFDQNVPDETGLAGSIVTICSRILNQDTRSEGESDFLGICRAINNEQNSSVQRNAVESLAARQLADVANLVSFQNTIQVGDIGTRLSSLRAAMSQNTRDVASAPLQHPSPGLLASNNRQVGGAAGDDETGNDGPSRFGVFVSASRGDGDKETTERSSGFDYKSSSVTLGIDYLFTPSLIAGVAFGYGDSESELSQRSGFIDIQTENVSLYASKYFGGGWFVDGIAGVGKVEVDNRRFINFIANDTSIDQEAAGSFESDQTILSLGFGRALSGAVDIDLAARINYIDSEISRFAESTDTSKSGFGLALEIDGYDLKSITSDLSLAISKPFSLNWGVLIPKASVRYIHEFETGEDTLRGRFLVDVSSFDFTQSGLDVGSPENRGTIFNVPLERLETDYGNLQLGVTALLPRQFSINASVSNTLGVREFDHLYYSVALRKDF